MPSFLEYLEKTCPGDDAHDGLGDSRPLLERCGMCREIYEEHRKEVEQLEHLINEKPSFDPAISGEAGERFQRFWEALVGLREKADFKVIVKHLLEVESKLQETRRELAQKG